MKSYFTTYGNYCLPPNVKLHSTTRKPCYYILCQSHGTLCTHTQYHPFVVVSLFLFFFFFIFLSIFSHTPSTLLPPALHLPVLLFILLALLGIYVYIFISQTSTHKHVTQERTTCVRANYAFHRTNYARLCAPGLSICFLFPHAPPIFLLLCLFLPLFSFATHCKYQSQDIYYLCIQTLKCPACRVFPDKIEETKEINKKN